MGLARFAADAMATRFELVLEAEGEARQRGIAEEVFEEIRHCEASWSAFARESVISRVNREAHGSVVVVDSATFELLEEALRVAVQSDGCFDPTLGVLMERHGFRGAQEEGAGTGSWGSSAVQLDPQTRGVSLGAEGLRLDLGGIAKGRALDLAAEVLRDHGVERALLHGGTSSVLGLGAPAGLPGWRVALSSDDGAPIAVLRDRALSVSASTGRASAAGGHIIDPHSGAPCQLSAMAAVISTSASLADAWSTALCVAGERVLSLPSDCQALCQGPLQGEPWRPGGTLTDQFILPTQPAQGQALPA